MTQKKALAVVSGGLDSTTLVYELLDQGYEVDCVSFNYGQRHKKELQFAKMTAHMLGLKHDIVDLSGLTHLISNSALTAGTIPENVSAMHSGEPFIDVPEGHYAEENMKATVVPNRNMIMISIAAGIAINRQSNTVALGVHAGDHFIYPDCRPEFVYAVGQAILEGNVGFHNFEVPFDVNDPDNKYAVEMGFTHAALPIFTPFLQSTKTDIAYRALELNVPLHLTWSCYKGGENHCGRCGTCVERLEAVDAAIRHYIATQPIEAQKTSPDDMTVYDDNEYWRQAVRKAKEEA